MTQKMLGLFKLPLVGVLMLASSALLTAQHPSNFFLKVIGIFMLGYFAFLIVYIWKLSHKLLADRPDRVAFKYIIRLVYCFIFLLFFVIIYSTFGLFAPDKYPPTHRNAGRPMWRMSMSSLTQEIAHTKTRLPFRIEGVGLIHGIGLRDNIIWKSFTTDHLSHNDVSYLFEIMNVLRRTECFTKTGRMLNSGLSVRYILSDSERADYWHFDVREQDCTMFDATRHNDLGARP